MTLARFNYISIIISILCSVHFFGLYYKIGEKLNVLIDFIFISIVFLYSFTNIKFALFTRNQFNETAALLYKKYFLYFFVFLLISTISCLYFHDQNILRTIQSMRTFSYFILFFMLIKSGVSRSDLESLCYFFAFCYCLIFSMQLLLYPIEIIPLGRIEEYDRGFLRIRLEGVGFVTLVGMISLNKFLESKNFKHFFILVISLFFIYLLGFRTLLLTFVLSLLLLVYFYYKSISLAILAKVITVLLIFILYKAGFITDFFDSSVEQTSGQLSDIDDYIRVLTFNFLFEETTPNLIALIFGNGFPYLESKYGYEILYVGTELNGFIAADLGLIGFAFYFGVITTLIYVLMLITPIFLKFNKDSIYLKVYGFYLLISSFTTAESFRLGMFGVICIYLYLVVIESKNEKTI